jgi:hypothetical protein
MGRTGKKSEEPRIQVRFLDPQARTSDSNGIRTNGFMQKQISIIRHTDEVRVPYSMLFLMACNAFVRAFVLNGNRAG